MCYWYVDKNDFVQKIVATNSSGGGDRYMEEREILFFDVVLYKIINVVCLKFEHFRVKLKS